MPASRKSSDRYRSMAHYFGALIRDLRDTYELRVGEPLTVAQLAARAGYSASMIGQIERGESLPESGQRVQSLDVALYARAEGVLKS
jgi:transcriptional regulator with XRE-family HTH domain